MNRFLLLVPLILSATIGYSVSEDCKTWFAKAKLDPEAPDCLERCGVLPKGMDSFACSQQCNELCAGADPGILSRLLYYPGLTAKERELVRAHPKEAVVVFMQKSKAESATLRVFKRDSQNDESDAFRHFVWAGLLSKELGTELAQKFLDAHEAAGPRDDSNRAMDLSNNRAGLLAADRLRRLNKLSQDELEKESLMGIQSGALVVLKPRGSKK